LDGKSPCHLTWSSGHHFTFHVVHFLYCSPQEVVLSFYDGSEKSN
jgi:hypothetical protein